MHTRFAVVRAQRLGILVLALGAGCTGSFAMDDGTGGAPGAGDDDPPPADEGPKVVPPPVAQLACDANAAPVALPLRRLSGIQYRNSVEDLLRHSLGPELGAKAVQALAPVLDQVPGDDMPLVGEDEHGTFRRVAQSVQGGFVDESYAVAEAAGKLLASPPYAAKLLAGCTEGSCLEESWKRFAARALRRPLEPDQIGLLRHIYAGPLEGPIDAQALADVLGSVLAAPQFLYTVELGRKPLSGRAEIFDLDPYEIASRLSYQFWDSLPDDTLWDKAKSGALSDPKVFAAEVDRLLANERARPVLDRFFAEWMLVEEIPALDGRNGEPFFKAFAARDLPTPNLRTEIIREAADLARHLTWTTQGRFEDLLSTDLAFPRGQLAALYGLAPWDGVSAPPSFPPGVRPGLLTRAAKLVHREGVSRPVMRGTLIRTKILCDEIPPPPDNALDAAMESAAILNGRQSTRERFEVLTETSAACAACHKTLINPIGFALEGFDALGRLRAEEKVYDESGALLATKAVNTATVPQIAPEDRRPSSGPGDLVKLIVESGKATRCFARQYVRFTNGRVEDPARDGCAIAAVEAVMQRGGTLKDTFRSTALLPDFQRRYFGE